MRTQIIENCAYYDHPVIADDRGSLIALEGGNILPFELARAYFIFGTSPEAQRGFHAHKVLHQWVVAVAGSCVLMVDNGRERKDVELNSPKIGLYAAPMIWKEMRDFSGDCVLLVLASAKYDEAEYIRNYDDFMDRVRAAANRP